MHRLMCSRQYHFWDFLIIEVKDYKFTSHSNYSNIQMADKELEDFILNLNREAMNYLKQENFQLSLKTLKDAEKLLKTLNSPENFKLQGITLNNFGCFYKRINKPNVALKFLQRACEKESIEPVDRVNLAGTLLNMCAIF